MLNNKLNLTAFTGVFFARKLQESCKKIAKNSSSKSPFSLAIVGQGEYQFMYVGKCLCGVVKIKVKGEISDIIHCHCSLCRKNSGSAYATNGFINSKDFEIIAGKNNLSTFSFKLGRNRHFCTSCGSPVYSSNEQDPERYRIRVFLILILWKDLFRTILYHQKQIGRISMLNYRGMTLSSPLVNSCLQKGK